MTQQMRIEKIKNKILPILREAGVKKSSIFGSYARGEDTKGSDIDILIEAPKNMSLFGLAGLQIDLEDVLNKKVDVITYDSINHLLKDYILKDQVRIL